MSRLLKQILYGSFYLIFLALIIWGGKSLWFSAPASCFDTVKNQDEEEVDCGGSSCAACAIRELEPLIVQSVSVIPTAGKTSVVVKLGNPNLLYGAETFTYAITFKNTAGETIYTVEKESFIYAAEQKTIVEAGLELPIEEVRGNPEIVISNPQWKAMEEFRRPAFQTRDVKTVNEGSRTTITGLFGNTNSFGFSRVEIAGALKKEDDTMVGISETVIRDLVPFEERSFTIIIPSLSVPAKERAKLELFIEAFR